MPVCAALSCCHLVQQHSLVLGNSLYLLPPPICILGSYQCKERQYIVFPILFQSSPLHQQHPPCHFLLLNQLNIQLC